MNRLKIVLALVFVLLFGAQCSRTPPAQLTEESAQRTINTWAKDKSFTGQIAVESLQKFQSAVDRSVAKLKCNNFSYTFEGQPRNYSDTGVAYFKQERDGRWILEEIQLFQISGTEYPAFKAAVEVR